MKKPLLRVLFLGYFFSSYRRLMPNPLNNPDIEWFDALVGSPWAILET